MTHIGAIPFTTFYNSVKNGAKKLGYDVSIKVNKTRDIVRLRLVFFNKEFGNTYNWNLTSILVERFKKKSIKLNEEYLIKLLEEQDNDAIMWQDSIEDRHIDPVKLSFGHVRSIMEQLDTEVFGFRNHLRS